jgi:hypothetical protein
MRKLIGHTLFYKDKETGFDFYGRLTEFYDISILSYNKKDQVIRQFMVDFGSLAAMHQFTNNKPLTAIDKLVQTKTDLPAVVNKYIDKEGMTLIRSVKSKFVSSAVVASIKTFGENSAPAIFLKRIAWSPTNRSVIGIDTLALPLPAVEKFTVFIKKLFKGVDLEYELQQPTEENKDGDN